MISALHIKINSFFHFIKRDRIRAASFSLFFRQFATLISAGIPLLHCFDILEKCQAQKKLCALIFNIKEELLTGKSLSACLKTYPHYFDELTYQLIYLSEQTGNLEMMLNKIAHHQEADIAFRRRIVQALFYPCLITLTACLITLVMLVFIIPKFAELYSASQSRLPLLTNIIFYLALKFREYILFVIGFITMICFLLYRYRRHPAVNHYRNLLVSRLPLIQTYRHKILLAHFNRQFALAFSAGIPILSALQLAGAICKTDDFAQSLEVLRSAVNSGSQIHQAMKQLPVFPAFMRQMIKIGEESGTLEHMLTKIADLFEAEVDQLLSSINQLLEPLIILILGALIGGLVIGMYLPLFQLGSVL